MKEVKCQPEECLLLKITIIKAIMINQKSILKAESIIKIKILGKHHNITPNIRSMFLLKWKHRNMLNRTMNLAAKMRDKEITKVQIFELA